MRRFQDLKPQTKVGLVTVTLVGSALALLIVSLVRLDAVRRESVDLSMRSIPARDQLVKVGERLSLVTTSFDSLFSQPDMEKRVAALQATKTQITATDNEWQRFKQLALRLQGEQPLVDEFDTLSTHLRDMSGPVGFTSLAGLTQGTDPGALFADRTVVELRDTQARMSEIVRRIEHEIYDPVVNRQLSAAAQAADTGIRDLWIAFVSVMFVSAVIATGSFRSARRSDRIKDREQRRAQLEASRNELETRLYRALEMASTEDAAFKLVGQALAEAIPDQPAEVLVSDSSVAHFRQVLSTDLEHHGPGCPVVSPSDCPAALRGNSLVFSSSAALDACPFLRERHDTPLAAACQPISIAGKSVGVIHTTFADGLPSTDESIVALELIARRAGERVGMLRAFAESESAARSDPLTGLLNRRSLDNSVRRMVLDGGHYAVAYGDLDHFKHLNDTFGHDVGDRALRLFAKALRDAVRPNDLACRYGGEEFVVVLPDCPMEEAVPVIERVRSSVADIGTTGRVPVFTVSFGVASSTQADSFERVVSLADAALLKAKADGRDRVVVASGAWTQGALPPGPPPALAAGSVD